MSNETCPKCGAGLLRKWHDPLTQSLDHVYGCKTRHVFYKDGTGGVYEESKCLRNQLERANERIEQLLSAQMDAAEAKLGTTPAGEHLNAVAAECHRLATARGKYHRKWTVSGGARQIIGECREWLVELEMGNEVAASDEFGDILHAVLSVGHHMGYDVAECLARAMDRNRERVRLW